MVAAVGERNHLIAGKVELENHTAAADAKRAADRRRQLVPIIDADGRLMFHRHKTAGA